MAYLDLINISWFQFQGIKMMENESGWSKNMKQGIASMMQLDFTHMQLQTPMKPHSFVTHEVGNDWWEHPVLQQV